jgi:hypothetical protein
MMFQLELDARVSSVAFPSFTAQVLGAQEPSKEFRMAAARKGMHRPPGAGRCSRCTIAMPPPVVSPWPAPHRPRGGGLCGHIEARVREAGVGQRAAHADTDRHARRTQLGAEPDSGARRPEARLLVEARMDGLSR